MSYMYHCPKCDGLLNPNVRVVLIAKHGEKAGIVLMSSKLGDFQVICDKGFCQDVSMGDTVEFCCPVCHGSLTSESHNNFAELKIVNSAAEGKKPFILRFCRVSEEHATFLYDGEKVKEFGEEAKNFHDEMVIEGDWGW